MAMLCTCSGEQFKLEEMPRSPESLATRDHSANASSSTRVGDFDSRFEDDQVEEVESALRDTISLNYEEARALLGRLEYEKGNYDAALHVLQGIDLAALKPRIVKSISANYSPTKVRSKGGAKSKFPPNLMSVHSVSLLVEAILVKAKSLEGLGRYRDAAVECSNLIEILETVWPDGVPDGVATESKLLELLHKALVSLPKLWIQIGCLEEAVSAYRRAVIKPWNLSHTTHATLQKEFAVTLLYSTNTGTNDLEEAILLLLTLMRKMISKDIKYDPDIINHLEFALSLTGQFNLLANQIESLLPGVYTREERWYLLALCYNAMGSNEDSLNVIRISARVLQRKNKAHVRSLLLGAKLCYKNSKYANEGMQLTIRALEFMKNEKRYNHSIGMAYNFLGCCLGHCARSLSNPEKSKLQHSALKVLYRALELENNNSSEIMCSVARENFMQRKPKAAVQFGKKYIDTIQGGLNDGWKLLILAVSSQQQRRAAEEITDFVIGEADGGARLEYMKLKALLQVSNGEFRAAIDTYGVLLARVKAQEETEASSVSDVKVEELKSIEMDAWLDLASIYIKLESWQDANLCLKQAKFNELSSPKYWHVQGTLFEAQLREKESLMSYSIALSIDPDYVPSMVSTSSILRKLGGNSMSVARSFTRSALRVDPACHEAWLNLGSICKNDGSISEAADCFQTAFELMESAPVSEVL